MSARPPLHQPSASLNPLRPPPTSLEDDDDAFVSALSASSSHLLHTLPPAIHPASGALDVLLIHSVVLVAYSAGQHVVIARGSDLAALRCLPAPPAHKMRCFRQRARSSLVDEVRTSIDEEEVAFGGSGSVQFGSDVLYKDVNGAEESEDVKEFNNVVEANGGCVESDASCYGSAACACDVTESAGGSCTALAFRQTDGALAAAFGSRVVIYEGWDEAAAFRGILYDSKYILDELEFSGCHVSTLAWDATGTRLSAIGDGVVVWICAGEISHLGHRGGPQPQSFRVLFSLSSRDLGVPRLGLGALSPDGNYLAAAATFARVGWVWTVIDQYPGSSGFSEANQCPTHSSSYTSPPSSPRLYSAGCAEISFGTTGIAALEWKPRGGGNPALMTVDRNGTLRLWTKVAGSQVAAASRALSSTSSPLSQERFADRNAGSWMEEIARSPHVEPATRAGAAFVHWGGGGGIADDESDVAATTASHPFLAEGSAPKPSRALHWIVCVAGGGARAWRVRGLDDYPRAQFARLEPGSGQALSSAIEDPKVGEKDCLNSDDALDDVVHASLSGAYVKATRAIAPVPLTTSTKKRIGLVKSYAISNGERRLRSPEPPEPPNIAAVFVILTRNGASFLSRYDLCPTLETPALCRARIGAGHRTSVERVLGLSRRINTRAPQHPSSWLVSLGSGGDALLWRADSSSTTREPLILSAQLPGPHCAVAFASFGDALTEADSVELFGVDALTHSLHLYTFQARVRPYSSSCVQDVGMMQRRASHAVSKRSIASSDSVKLLLSMEYRISDGERLSDRSLLLGILRNGRMRCWVVSRSSCFDVEFCEAEIFFIGRRCGVVTCADSSDDLGSEHRLIGLGSVDGCVRLYEVLDGEVVVRSKNNGVDDIKLRNSTGPSCVVKLREVAFLGEKDGSEARVDHVNIMESGDRLALTREDGSLVLWERSISSGLAWTVVFSLPSRKSNVFGIERPRRCGGLSFGTISSGRVVLYASRAGVGTEIFQKLHGSNWSLCSTIPEPADVPLGPMTHIGHGVIVTSSRQGLLALDGMLRDERQTQHSFIGDLAKDILAHLMCGARAWQTIAVLEELAQHVVELREGSKNPSRSDMKQILAISPPSLRLLFTCSESALPDVGNVNPARAREEPKESSCEATLSSGMYASGAFVNVKRNVFAELMARSEKRFEAERTVTTARQSSKPLSLLPDSNSLLNNFAKKLRAVRMANFSENEQALLLFVTEGSGSVREIISSLDEAGSRFAIVAATFLAASETLCVPMAVIASAFHSSATDALQNHFLSDKSGDDVKTFSGLGTFKRNKSNEVAGSIWSRACRLGAGWWITTTSEARILLENIARSQFNSSRDPDDAALWYIALGKVKALAVLYKAQQNPRMAEFLSRDFKEERHRVAAGKNAYVLVSRHRLHLATGFFILAGDVRGAIALARSRIKDDQLAMLLARVLMDDNDLQCLYEEMLAMDDSRRDRHRQGLLLWMLGRHEECLQAVADPMLLSACSPVGGCERLGYLNASLMPAALCLTHVTAMTARPPICGTNTALTALRTCRELALRSLAADGCSLAAVRIGTEILSDGNLATLNSMGSPSDRTVSVSKLSAVRGDKLLSALLASCTIQIESTCTTLLKERAVAASLHNQARKSPHPLNLLTEEDLRDLSNTTLGPERAVKAACASAADLGRTDHVDASCAIAIGAIALSESDDVSTANISRIALGQLEDCCLLAAARCISRSLCAISFLHRPVATISELTSLYYKLRTSIEMVQNRVNTGALGDCKFLVDAMKQSGLALRVSIAYMRGDWSTILEVLRSCENTEALHTMLSPLHRDENSDNRSRITEGTTNLTRPKDSISLEGLRHIASNPAVLSISPSIGHRRRSRRAPSLALVDIDGASSALLVDEAVDRTTFRNSEHDPTDFIRAHPSLNSALGSSSVSYLTRHVASKVAGLVARIIPARGIQGTGPLHLVLNLSRLLEASEAFEHAAADAVVGWLPLGRFGASPFEKGANSTSDVASSFVDLWCAMGNLPEYAPTLSEAATVAAAEVASIAALRAAQGHTEKHVARRRQRIPKRNDPRGASLNATRSSVDIFDTTSADSLYGAYPVRFSVTAKGPWSGRGQYFPLYRESHALFRTMCISSSDPPAVIVATPKGVQEIVPSSYITMPTGFRSHYFASRAREQRRSEEFKIRDSDVISDGEEMTCSPPASVIADDDLLEHFETSFGEGPYIPLDLHKKYNADECASPGSSSSRRRSLLSASRKPAVWRHQVEATALASHPLRRRFASGGTDGTVRLWDFGDPISLGSLRTRSFGRVSSLKFSAYGNAIVSVHACGHIALWQEPDNYLSTSMSKSGRHRDATVINAFHSRNASDAVFLDERFTIAAVGDETCPPAVGHSLRIFDIREAHAAFVPSWSARVHNGGEARCLALLEDRVRVVTGGADGSLCVVDMRMSKSAVSGGSQARVAELLAHDGEVTCLSLESPRGRALVSGSRNGDIKLWDSRTLLQLDHVVAAHPPTRHYWSGSGIGGLVGSYGTQSVILTDRTLISCGGDGIVKTWGPGVYSTSDLNVL